MQSCLGSLKKEDPLTFREAIEAAEHREWEEAMAEEIAELDKKTWKLVPLPSGVRPIKTKWVY